MPSPEPITPQETLFLVLKHIPPGRVVTYGHLARMAGYPGAARWAGSVLRQLPNGSSLPWHRVINSRGEISLPPDSASHTLQRQRLEEEGIEFVRGKIDLKRYLWS